MCHEIVPFHFFPQQFQNIETILNLQAIQKQAASQI